MGSTINLVQVVQDAGHDDFGFLVIRKSYGDEALWEQWAEAFNNLVEKSVVEHAGAEGVIDKLMMAMIDDPELHNSSWFDIQRYGIHYMLLDRIIIIISSSICFLSFPSLFFSFSFLFFPPSRLKSTLS